MTGVLTVRENIMFSAQLRLPRKMSYDEKVYKVNKLIEELGLDDCCDTKVYCMHSANTLRNDTHSHTHTHTHTHSLHTHTIHTHTIHTHTHTHTHNTFYCLCGGHHPHF